VRCANLIYLAEEYQNKRFDSCLYYCEKALNLSHSLLKSNIPNNKIKARYLYYYATGLGNYAALLRTLGQNKKSMQLTRKCLRLRLLIDDKKGAAASFKNI
jgi:hypothetical protein